MGLQGSASLTERNIRAMPAARSTIQSARTFEIFPLIPCPYIPNQNILCVNLQKGEENSVMSQHYFETVYQNRPIEILMGWDKPAQGYYMVIEWSDEDDDDQIYLYTHLNDEDLPEQYAKTVAPFIGRLAVLGITIPSSMLQGVLADGASNVGNRTEYHN
jgi:hypothetical protein